MLGNALSCTQEMPFSITNLDDCNFMGSQLRHLSVFVLGNSSRWVSLTKTELLYGAGYVVKTLLNHFYYKKAKGI